MSADATLAGLSHRPTGPSCCRLGSIEESVVVLSDKGGGRGRGEEGEGGVTSLVVTGGTEGVTGRYAYRGVSVQPGWPGSDSGVNKLY